MNPVRDKFPRPAPTRPFPFPTGQANPQGSIKPGGPHWVDGPLNPGEVKPGGPIKPGGPHWVDKPLLPHGNQPTESLQLSPEALSLLS